MLLVSGRVSVPKPLSQIQRSTRWLLQGLSPRTSFGGFGVKGSRVEYRRGDLTEWYVNDERGLEQGFTIASPPVRIPNGEEASLLVLQLAVTGDLSPTLTSDGQAIELTTEGGVRVLRYGSLYVEDARGRELPAHLAIDSSLISIVVDDSSATYPIVVDPLLSSPSWTAESNQASVNFGLSVGTAGDVNGDGYSDVVVGAYRYDNGEADEGRAYVYHGSATGLSATAHWTTESNQASALFGVSVGTAGDVDGDGYSDVIVGAQAYDNGETDEGRAFLYRGSAAGLSATAAWTAESDQAIAQFGHSVGTAGDVNGDGYSDVIVGAEWYDNGESDEGRAFVYQGSATGLSATPAWTAESDQASAAFGGSVGTAGDVNGDGYSDVIIGAPWYDSGETDEGRAFVYHGSSAGLATGSADWTAEIDQVNAWFGYFVGTTGDVNGDGYSDVIVGAWLYDNGETDEGGAFVYHGSAAGLTTGSGDWTAEGDQANARFGVSVGTAGDVNGDGYSDVIVGAHKYDSGEIDEGWAFVYHGSAVGLSATADWTAEGNQTLAHFGSSVGTVGDVNGDGYSDVVVGAPEYDSGQTDEGRAFVFHGAATGLGATAGWTAESDQAGALFGVSVGTAGDVNGDGYSDVIVGAWQYDNGQTDEGRAFVYHGSAVGLSATPDWTAESDQAGALFGVSVGTAGDVNGDGYSDVIVGAYQYDNGESNEGRAFVYHGSSAGLTTGSANWTAESNQAGARFGYSVGTAGDVNGDGYSDVIVGAYQYDNGQTDEGRAFVYHGSATGLSATAGWTAESDQAVAQFGYSVGTAGDVNGDGYSDVIVGAQFYDNGETDEGRAFVFHGAAAGLSATAGWTAESNQADARFGRSVGTAGDVDGDGYSDVIVGAFLYDNGEADEGRAFVHHGSSAGLTAGSADWTAEGDQAGASFGISVGTAGDVNGDGYSDVIVGAYRYDNGETDEGRAFVYHGSAAGPIATAGWTAESNQAGANFGWWVGTAEDVNGDGYSDVIVGAWLYDNGQTDEGRAFVYHSEVVKPAGTFLFKWGTQGSGDGQLNAPAGVGVGPGANVYVADTGNHRIHKFTSAGGFLTKWGSQGVGDGQFDTPRNIGVDGDGNVYVPDYSNHRVQKFTSAGTFITKWGSNGVGDGEFNGPWSLAVDSDGNVYVSDSSNHRIQKFTSAGVFLIEWGSQGTGDGQFSSPRGIAVDASGNVYVGDAGNHRIQKFTSGGAFLTKWGSQGSGDGQLDFPDGVATDAWGNVYVADSGNSRIQKFSSDGTFLAKWGSSGSGDGQFSNVQGIAVDSEGNAFVADTGNHRIQAFASGEATSPLLPPLWVTNLNDSGPGSLRRTIADSTVGGTIKFNVTGTITLTSGQLTIDKDLTIQGPGASSLSISGNNASRIFEISSTSSVAISGVTITNGNVVGTGGGVRNSGTLTLRDITLTANTVTLDSGPNKAEGGAVHNSGTLTVISSSLTSNSATGGSGHGRGGAINNTGSLTVTGSTISGNSATGSAGNSEGGGIEIVSGGVVTVSDSTISGNSTTWGGGIYVSNGSLTITNTTISGNSASWKSGGIGVYDSHTMAAYNSTISGNTATNSTGGIHLWPNATATLANTIVAGNSGDCFPHDATSIVNSLGYNLDSDGSCGLSGTGDKSGVSASLGALADNGGSTKTHALLAGSLAIDAGNPALPGSGGSACAATDQRSSSRPQGARCDIGAFESPVATALTVSNLNDSGPGSLRRTIADSTAGGTIKFNVTGTITLTSGQLTIDKDLTIQGHGASSLSISGNNASRVLEISSTSTVAISGVTIKDGSSASGGGVVNNGTLSLSDSTVTGNTATTGDGGGIFNIGTLTLARSTVRGNTASGSGSTGGAGIINSGTTTVTNSTISGNSGTGNGNSSGAGIYNYNEGAVTIANSTISKNSASNTGGGLFNDSGIVDLVNTIVADNTAPSRPDCFGSISSSGYNVIGDTTGCSFTATTGDLTDVSASLGALADNGGPTKTHALPAGSPAIDAGNPAAPGSGGSACDATDQRGSSRPQGARCDIGAFESPLATALTVSNFNDSGPGSLRRTIAESTPGGTIKFNVTGTITLTSGQLTIDKALTIKGPGASSLSISGNNASRVFEVNSGVTATISGVTVRDGNVTGNGGGITVSGTLTVDSSTIASNTASNNGGGINTNSGSTLTVSNSTISQNTATFGAGVHNNFATLTIASSAVSNNNGTGVRNAGAPATLTMTGSTVSDNSGHGVLNIQGTATIDSSDISRNISTAGGGIRNQGVMTVTNSTVSENTKPSGTGNGGGINNNIGGKLTLINTTISANTSTFGGGIYNADTLTLVNSTVSGNTATSLGGGIHDSSATTTLANTIAAGNSAPSSPDCDGSVTSQGYNLIGSTSGCSFTATTGDLTNVAASLGALADNGGLTKTHALLAGSPAIDAGNPALPGSGGSACAAVDQRGFSRPHGVRCDIGAFELFQMPQEAKLTAGDGASGDLFGQFVSLSADTMVVGAQTDDDNGSDSGSAYVFVNSSAAWTQQAKLVSSDIGAGDNFGGSAAISGETIAMGARLNDDAGTDSGSAYVFVRSGNAWSQQAKLTSADAAGGDQFGESVAIDGDTVVVGARFDDDNGGDSGSAYVFVRSGATWAQQAKLTAGDGQAGDNFGWSVAVKGDTVVVGARADDDNGTDSGSAYVFVRSGTTWTQQAKLSASDGAAGDEFAYSVTVSGDTAVIGAILDDDAGTSSGSAYVFVRSGGTWTQQQKLTSSDAAAGDTFGASLAIRNNTAVIGALNDDHAATSDGSAYVFVRTGGTWTQQAKLAAADPSAEHRFGGAVSLSDGTAAVGAYLDDDRATDAGAVYVFETGADLRIAKSVSPDPVVAGGTLTYTLTVTNAGPSTSTGVAITDTLPAGVSFVSSTGGGLGKIAFHSNRSGGFFQIYVMEADGSNVTQLTNTSARNAEPAWSPDGSKIAFYSQRDGNQEIYVMDADGSNQTRITTNTADDRRPAWSPDGAKIAFQSVRDGNWEVYVMNADGSNQTNLTNQPTQEEGPVWSPDGSKIAYFSLFGGNEEVFVMNADGSNQTNLTSHSAHDEGPDWSPDGTKIAFRSHRDGDQDIYVMDADGSNQTQLADLPADQGDPVWSRDGTKIAFPSLQDGNYEIYSMNADGSSQTRLTDNAANDHAPDWQPGCTHSSDAVTCALGSLGPGATTSVSITVSVPATTTHGTILTNTATTTANQTDPNSANNIATATTTVERRADLSVTKTDSPDPVAAGGTLTYTLTVINDGPSEATSVTLTDPLPAGVSFASVTSSATSASKIVFFSDRDGDREIYIMNADGSDQTRLTSSAGSDQSPSISPDGTRITFSSTRGGASDEIYVMNLDGSSQTRLTNNGAGESSPSWCANDRIAFASIRDGQWEIYVMDAVDSDGDGNADNQTRLTSTGAHETTVACSGDGSKIAFDSGRDGNAELYVMNADGTDQTRLTNSGGSDHSPEWSPDGEKISWACPAPAGMGVICVMNADGTGQVEITDGTAQDNPPAAWSPDGTKLAFHSNRDGDFEIYAMNPDGTGVEKITNVSGLDGGASWGGAPACGHSSGAVTCSLGALAAGATTTVTITVTVAATTTGTLTNTASVSATETDPVANNTSTATTTVVQRADLSVTKAGSPDPVAAGGALAYTLTVANAGPSSATGVTVTDTLPAGVTAIATTTGVGQFAQVSGADLRLLHPSAGGVRIGDYYYVVSGEIQSRGVFTPQIERAKVLGDGNLGPWEVAATLPASRDNAVVAATDSDIYILGDHPGSTLVERVPVAADGSLGAPVTDRAMATARYRGGAMVHGGFLYIIGGADNALSPAHLDSVERAPINAGGSLGTWETLPSLPTPLSAFALAKTAKYVWLLGGDTPSGLATTTVRAKLLPGGAVGPWETLSVGVETRWLPSALAVGNCIFFVGEHNTTVGDQVDCIRLDVNEDVVEVVAQPNMTVPRFHSNVFTDGSYLFVTGGASDAGGLNGWKITERATLINDAPPGCSRSGGGISCGLGTLASGATTTLTITVTVDATTTGTLTNVAGVTSDATDPVAANNTSTATTTVTQQADLSVSKGALSEPAASGGTLTYTITVANDGPSPAEDVTLTDTLPAGVTFVSATSSPPLSGRITFRSDRDGNFEIYVMNADGSNQTRLTNDSAADYGPAWSRDGTKIAFQSFRDGNGEIYVMNADGSGQTRLTTNSGNDADPAWSPDGTKIAFWSNRHGNGEIYVMNADGSDQTRLTNKTTHQEGPSWSPDGARIAFMSKLAHVGQWDIYVINADGSNETRLTFNQYDDFQPAWAWDGSKFAFVSTRDGECDASLASCNRDREIYVMNADGTGQSRLTNNSAFDNSPAWSSDGSKIAFISDRDGNRQIYVMNADGSNQTRLSNNLASDSNPDWFGGSSKRCTHAAGSVTCALGTLNAGSTTTVAITVRVGATTTGVITNTASITSTTPDPVTANNTTTATTTVVQLADLSVTKVASPDPAASGGSLTYTITVTNDGPSDATAVTLTDTLPVGVSFVSVTSSATSTSKIAFSSNRDGDTEIYIMNADGSQQTRLTSSVGPDQSPSISPDGTRITFESTRGGASDEIYVMNVDGSGQTRLTNNGVDESSASWCGNDRIAFASIRDGQWEIYVMDADGSDQTRLTFTGAHETTVACSRDGTKIAFESAADIYVMNADGTNQTRLTNSAGSDSTPEWSPDGTKISWNCPAPPGKGNVCVMNSDGTGQATITDGSNVDTAPAAWSPDGTKLAFHSNRDGDSEIYVMNIDGTGIERITNVPGVDGGPSWGGASACSQSGGTVTCSLGTLPVGSSTTVTITVAVAATTMGAIGNTVGVSSAVTDPVAANNTTTATTTVTRQADLSVSKTDSRDPVLAGEEIMYTLVVTNDGPSDATGVTLTDILPSGVTFTSSTPPKTEKIVFKSFRDGDFELYAMDRDGSGQARLTFAPGQDQAASISPDGTRVAFGSVRDGATIEVYVMDIDGSNVTRLTTNSVDDNNPSWCSKTRIAFASIRDGQWEVYIMNSDGSGQTRLTSNAAHETTPECSPDGTKIAFDSARDGNAEIYVMDADGSNQTRLTNSAGGDSGPTWKPDGTKIAWTCPSADICVMNADGSGQTNLTSNGAGHGAVSWSPDGTRISFHSERDGNVEIYTVSAIDGSGLTRLTNVAQQDSGAFWGPTTGCSASSGVVSCALGDLAAGATTTVTITATAGTTTAGVVTNTAGVSSAEADPVAGNNTTTATTVVQERAFGPPTAQQAKLLAGDGATGDDFGVSVAISGDTAVVGARYDDGRGSVYIFVRVAGAWTQQARLTASDGAAGDDFGYSVGIDGDTVVVGAPDDDDVGTTSGSAYIFVRSGNTWTQQAKPESTEGHRWTA